MGDFKKNFIWASFCLLFLFSCGKSSENKNKEKPTGEKVIDSPSPSSTNERKCSCFKDVPWGFDEYMGEVTITFHNEKRDLRKKQLNEACKAVKGDIGSLLSCVPPSARK